MIEAVHRFMEMKFMNFTPNSERTWRLNPRLVPLLDRNQTVGQKPNYRKLFHFSDDLFNTFEGSSMNHKTYYESSNRIRGS